MGQEINLIPAKGERKKIHAFLKEKLGKYTEDKYWMIEGPDLEGFDLNCWIEWRGRRLDIGHQSHALKSQWAKTIAFELKKRFKFDKAGWDSVGYYKDFWKREAFSDEAMDMKALSKHWEKLNGKEIRRITKKAARKIFE